MAKNNVKKNPKQDKTQRILQNKKDYAFSMSMAPSIDQGSSFMQMLPVLIFGALVIMVVLVHPYTRPMTQFYWTGDLDDSDLSEFFSFGKAVVIYTCAVIAMLMGLYKVTTQSLSIKKSYAYIPMGIYSIFVILSYAFSDYKEFALIGWNDRFEGTLTLLAYMIMLFLIINVINSEQNIKQVVWSVAISSTLLGLIGVSQGTGHDFFRTRIGQKILCMDFRYLDQVWAKIDEVMDQGQLYLEFTFNNNEIYQTVYNINYVAFYLTLLVPLFTMLFIRTLLPESKEPLWKKLALGGLLGLLCYNLVGSASAGGYLGIGVAVIIAIIILNKQFLKWIKPLLVVILIVAIILGLTTSKWLPEVKNAIGGVLNIYDTPTEEITPEDAAEATPASVKATIDFMETVDNTITMSFDGNPLTFVLEGENDDISNISAIDSDGQQVPFMAEENGYTFYFVDERYFPFVEMIAGYNEYLGHYIMQLVTCDTAFTFMLENGEAVMYIPATAKTTKLSKVEHFGFENNQYFGSGRGYIWSRSFPLLKKTLFIGTGADTYCAVFPQNDYAGKYNAYGATNILLIVDKPHNMYIHMGVGTGCISLISMLALYFIYFLQSCKVFRKRELGTNFLFFSGIGVFFGATAFMVTGLVDDSTVSVMPMFYTFLGMGLAINMMIQRLDGRESSWRPWDKKTLKAQTAQ